MMTCWELGFGRRSLLVRGRMRDPAGEVNMKMEDFGFQLGSLGQFGL